MAQLLLCRQAKHFSEEAMSLTTNKTKTPNTASKTRVVATGKRLKGTWIMESKLEPGRRLRRSDDQTAQPGRNQRVRTLH